MKKRRVILVVEVESNEQVKELKANIAYGLNYGVPTEGSYTKVLQIQTNVVQRKK